MNSFEFNKIAGAILGTLLLVFGLKSLAGALYHAEKPEKPGMAIEVADSGAPAEAAPVVEIVPIAVRLASADAAKGQALAKACAACHVLDASNTNKVGPGLWDVVDRQIAHHEGFSYSEALASKNNEAWTYEALDHFILKPKEFAPGTKMGYAGLKDDAKRADLIAYLRTLSDAPKDLPTP
jgi:cytochrome c